MDRSQTPGRHSHVFLGEAHARGERNVWAVIALTSAMMLAEIVGGAMFGSIALVADGVHMSTHAGALLLAAVAYTLARRRADDDRFTFGTGKFGDLAGFSSALILAMIAAMIAFESAARFFAPTSIAFAEAIPIAALGLIVNAVSAWLLSRGGHRHHHHGDAPSSQAHRHDDEIRQLEIGDARYALTIFEAGGPPRFRLAALGGASPAPQMTQVEATRRDGSRQRFAMLDRGGFLESADEIPEPHAFDVVLRVGAATAKTRFKEHAHGHGADALHRDNNLRAAITHVIADAAVSVLVIVGLSFAKLFGWLWMDPLMGLIGAGVIVSWSYGLIRDTARVLLDMNPDRKLAEAIRGAIERGGDALLDLHVWRLGPGHLGAILAVETDSARDADAYREAVAKVCGFSHLTIEVGRRPARPDIERRHVA